MLETAMSPTQRILAWLDEAHAFGTLGAYVDSLLDGPPDSFPINRLARDAASAARTTLRGKPAEVVDPAVRKALRATIFRFDLVMRINTVAHEMIDREQLLYLVFAGQLAILTSDDRTERRAHETYLGRLALCRDLAFGRVTELMAAEEARSIAEARYLEGHNALFPDSVGQWSECLRQAQELAVMADRLAELDGAPPAATWDPDDVSRRAGVLAADLIEPARSTALEKLDEGRQALAIATAWLRSKASAPVQVEPNRPPSGPTL